MASAETRILVVEDQRAVAGALRMRLRGLGYGVLDIAKDGSEAIAKAGELKPDLILMDIRLGDGMDGIEAAQKIRSQFGIPVVYVTAYADNEILDRARATDPAGFINKPFTTKDLLTTIDFALHRNQTAATPASVGSREAVITTDREGHVSFISSGAEQLTGWSRSQLIGSSLTTVLTSLYAMSQADAENKLQLTVSGTTEPLLTRKDQVPGEPVDTLSPLADSAGTVYGVALRFGGATVESGMASLQRLLDATRFILDQLDFGVIFLDRQLHIELVNRRARAILASGGALVDNRGLLDCSDTGCREKLVTAVRAVALIGSGAEDNSELVMFQRDDEPADLIGLVTPAAEDGSGETASVALLLFDPEFRQALSPSIMKAVYGLTRAEIRLVQTLVGGASLEDGAATLGIAVNTARTHLKHVFHKTGAKRQSELIHQIETGPSSINLSLRGKRR